MRHQLRNALVLFVIHTGLAACTESPDRALTAPDAALRVTPGAALQVPPTCDINNLKALGRGFSASNRDVLLTIIADVGTAVRSGPTAAGTDKVFDGLARLAAMRGTSAQNGTATGAMFDGLVKGLLACAQSNVLANTENVDFSPALGSGWLFEVRGKNNVPVRAYDDPIDWAYARGGVAPATWWAAGPQGTSWNASITTPGNTLAKRVLLYGYPDPTFLNISGKLGSALELRAIPKIWAGSFGLALDIGLCFSDASAISPTQRVNHADTFLPNKSLTCGFAPTPIASASRQGPLNPVLLARRALEFFTPRPAYAFFVGAVGGGVSELSPSAVYDLSAISVGGLGTIADGRISTPLATTLGGPVVVRITTTAASQPVAGIPIQMAIAGNNSSIAFFSVNGVQSTTVTRLTDASGYADFGGVHLVKAGGYQLSFQLSFDGITGPALLSNSFNTQNK